MIALVLCAAAMFESEGSEEKKIIDEAHEATVDVDGDGLIDTFEHDSGSGSQGGGDTVTLHLSKSATDLTVSVETSFGTMVDVMPIPAEILRADRKQALARVEALLFGKVTTTVDPGLRFLLDHTRNSKPSRLVFVDGEKPTFTTNIIRAEGRAWSAFIAQQHFEQKTTAAWIVYKGFLHTSSSLRAAVGSPNNAEKNAEVLLVTGAGTGRELWATCHGLYVRDVNGKKYAWAWVTSSNGFKMRFCSVGDHRIDAHAERVRVPFITPMAEPGAAVRALDASFEKTATLVIEDSAAEGAATQ